MDIDFKYKNLVKEVKQEFNKEKLMIPNRVLPIIASVNSNPREMFLIRVRNILLKQLDILKQNYKFTSDRYLKTKNLYDKFTDEYFKGDW